MSMMNADRDTNGKTRRVHDLYRDDSLDVSEERLTVAEAARRLGVTPDAIRKRIKRGTIRHDADADGKTHVYVDTHPAVWRRVDDASADGSRDKSADTSGDVSPDTVLEAKDETIAELRDHNHFLRRELERKDAILLRMAERIPELEAAPEPRYTPETASPRSDRGAGGDEPKEPGERRSWWRKFFGFE